jgi:stage III sporulation protein SpoIIIAA
MIEKFFDQQKENFLNTCLPKDAPPAQRRDMEIAFMSGAITTIGIMTELTTRMPDVIAVLEIGKLVDRLNSFRPQSPPKPSDETPHA